MEEVERVLFVGHGEPQQMRGVPDRFCRFRAIDPGAELRSCVGPDVLFCDFGAEEPGFARDEEEVLDRGERGELEGVLCEKRLL